MSFPAAEGPDTEMVVENASPQTTSASKGHSIQPDRNSSEFLDAPEQPPSETDNLTPGSEKADSGKSKQSNDSNVSFTSTVEYSQTPFDQYIHQVKELCHLLWPPSPKPSQDVKASRAERLLGRNRMTGILLPKRSRSVRASAPPKEFSIERLRGGGYNRITGITVKHSIDEEPTQLILRVPRFDGGRPDREVAVLRFVRQYTSIPVPEVKYMDFTSDNPLKKSYVIQNRILGHDLQADSATNYPSLNYEQKCTFAKEFALLLREMHNLWHPLPGLIEYSAESGSDQNFTVRPFDLESINGCLPEVDLNTKLPIFQVRPFVEDWDPPKKPPIEEKTYYFMITQFGRWKAEELRSDPATIAWSKLQDRMVTMADQMDELDFLGSNLNSLCHLDLLGAPRNIMADIKPDGTLKITAILDWDSACFAPTFVGCAPPMWLWAWDEEEEDEKHANDTPLDPRDREIKRIFEDTVGDSFLLYSYKPEYRLARELFRFAKDGIRSSTCMAEIEAMLKEWAEIYESRTAVAEEESADTEGVAKSNATDGNIDDLAETKASSS